MNSKHIIIGLAVLAGWSGAAYPAGIGISAEVYAKRFNALAGEMNVDVRIRSENAQVNQTHKRMVVTLPLDHTTKLMMGYGDDRKKLQDVMLSRPIGKSPEDLADTMSYMVLTSMAAFDRPKKKKVGSVTMDACNTALSQPGSTHSQQIDGRKISCTILGGALLLGIE